VDVVALKDTTREVGLVRITTAQSLESGLLVSKRFKKCVRKLGRVEGCGYEV
jgi:hypothetical protein